MKQMRRYSKEFKQEAVNLAIKSPSISKIANELGIPVATLHAWVSKLKTKFTIPQKENDDNKDVAALLEENRRLHKELAIAKEEKEILKKAATYFAQHQK